MITSHHIAQRRRRAFSLLELIVVMAIFSIVVGMTIPVVSKARSRSQEIFCQSNLRTLWTGLMQYTAEYNDRYPFGFIFNKTNPVNGRPTDGGASGYITWFSSIDKYLTNGTDEVFLIDANSGFVDGATTRRFHAAFRCPSLPEIFRQQVSYYQHGVVMPHMTLEIPQSFRAPGMPIISPAKVNQVYPHTALMWDTHAWYEAAPQTPLLFWITAQTTSGAALPCTMVDDNAMDFSSNNYLLGHPELTERRYRSTGADRFAASANPLKNPAGPIAFPSDQFMSTLGYPSLNVDPTGAVMFNLGSPRFRHTALGCNVLFADGSVRTLYLRPGRKVANAPVGQGSAQYIDSDFRRYMLMIKWPAGITDTHTVPTN